jgi:sn-glycerol 3-phosphate transport system ATP-binding protein
VTHDQTEAMTLGDRLVVMHQGHAAQVATPMEIWARPADTYVGGFIGSPAMNLLEAKLAEGGAAAALKAGPVLRFADGPRPGPDGRRVLVGIRPEHVRPDPAAGVPLALDLVEPLGSETVLHGRLVGSGEPLVAKLAGPAATASAAGTEVAVALPPEDWHVFDAETGRRLDPA